MNRFLLAIASFLIGAALAYWLVVSGMNTQPNNRHPSEDPANAIVKPSKIHPITSKMQKESDALKTKAAPDFAVADENGTVHKLAELTNGKPLLLYFIEKECPCCVTALPYVERVHQAYADVANVYGVINADAKIAQKWSKVNKATYPILVDPSLNLIKAYQAKCATYMILVTPEGRIERSYPGYSQDFLKDLGERIARLAKVQPRKFVTNDLTNKPTTGCAFNIDEETKH